AARPRRPRTIAAANVSRPRARRVAFVDRRASSTSRAWHRAALRVRASRRTLWTQHASTFSRVVRERVREERATHRTRLKIVAREKKPCDAVIGSPEGAGETPSPSAMLGVQLAPAGGRHLFWVSPGAALVG